MRRGKVALISSIILVLVLTIPIVGAQDDVYAIPDVPNGVDLDVVIAQVDDVEITLDNFVKRYRFEKLRILDAIKGVYDEVGPDLFDLESEDNGYAPSLTNLFANVVDPNELTMLIYEGLILESLYHQEAESHGIEIDQCDVDNYWAQQLGIAQVSECEFPDDFAELKMEFIQRAQTFTGLSESDINAIFVSLAEVEAVNNLVGGEVELPNDITVTTRHIRVAEEAIANEVFTRLQNGEDFDVLLREFTEDPGAEGNGGDLGYFSTGQMVPEFEEATFDAEIGEIVGPVQTQFGYHIIEVLDKQYQIHARHMLFDNEEDANQAIRLLNDGVDFAELAREYSLDMVSAATGGDLGLLSRGRMGTEFDEAAFNATVGEIVGPVQTQSGYHVIEVTEINPDVSQVSARHILVETEEEANSVLARLQSGEDFEVLARELSIDPSSQGHGGDTATIITGGQATGAYAESDILGILPELRSTFDAEVGEILPPISTAYGYFIVVVDEFSTRPMSFENAQFLKETHAFEWREDQLSSDRIIRTELWREYIPTDPLAVDVYADLEIVDTLLDNARMTYEENQAATTIVNILKTLQAPSSD